jgi:hypothetical protein
MANLPSLLLHDSESNKLLLMNSMALADMGCESGGRIAAASDGLGPRSVIQRFFWFGY